MKAIAIAILLLGFSGAVSAATLNVGDQAPCITLQQLDSTGTMTDVSTCAATMQGKKIVLDFFATWCGFCIENMPNWEALSAKYSSKAEFRIMGLDEDPAELSKYFAGKDLANYSVVFDSKLVSAEPFGIEGIPTTVVIGTDGKIQFIHVGTFETPEQLKELEDILNN